MNELPALRDDRSVGIYQIASCDRACTEHGAGQVPLHK